MIKLNQMRGKLFRWYIVAQDGLLTLD